MRKRKIPIPIAVMLVLWTMIFIWMIMVSTSEVKLWQLPVLYGSGVLVFGGVGLIAHLIIVVIKKAVSEAEKWNDPEEKMKRIKGHNCVCPRCKSTNIEYQLINEKAKVGFFEFILFGLFVLLKKDNATNYAVCKDCGHKWKTI